MSLSANAAIAKDARTDKSAAPQLQHRHFAFIAATVASMPSPARHTAARAFAKELAATNPSFDEARFMAACGF